MFVSIKGSPYTWFQASLERGDLAGVRAAAAELPKVRLDDALRVCLLVAEHEPHRLDRAAVRWLGRYALEHRDATVEGLRYAAAAFARLPDPDAARELEAFMRGWKVGGERPVM